MPMRCRYLLFGASGVLGSRLFEQMSNCDIVGTFFRRPFEHGVYCDLTDGPTVRQIIRSHKPQVILHAAGMTRPDKCENHRELAWQSNVGSVEHILSASSGAKIVYFSTDYVFDGDRGHYTELDRPRPINEYGRTKLAAEELLLSHAPDALVVRTSGLYGWSDHNREFLDHLTHDKTLECSVDHISSYTFLDDVYQFMDEVLSLTGIVHFVGPDSLTREQFARLACQILRVPTEIRGIPGPVAYSQTPRPRNSSLRSARWIGNLTPVAIGLRLLAGRLGYRHCEE